MEEEMPDEAAYAAYIQYLVDEGGLVLVSIDDEGEPIYRHNMEILERIAPEYAAVYLKEIEDSLISLYEKGLVDIEITDEGEVVYKISEDIDVDEFLGGSS